MLQTGTIIEIASEMKKFKLSSKYDGKARVVGKSKYTLIYYSGSNKRTGQLGTGFLISNKVRKSLIEYQTISNRLCRIRLKEHY